MKLQPEHTIKCAYLADYDTLLSLDNDQHQRQGIQHESYSAVVDNVASLPTYVYKAAPKQNQGPDEHSCQTRLECVPSITAEPPARLEGSTCEQADGEAEAASCAVCLEPYSEGQILMILPCIHQFHQGCISQHLRERGSRATCPICKTPCFL